MTCKECLHYEACIDKFAGVYKICVDEPEKHLELNPHAERVCDHFKDKSKFVELPCKVGDTVYTSYDHLLHKETNETLECKVAFIGFIEDGNYINLVDNYGHLHSMSFDIFDNTVFLTCEEAEKALERSKGNEMPNT